MGFGIGIIIKAAGTCPSVTMSIFSAKPETYGGPSMT